jgi:hypothetical protein
MNRAGNIPKSGAGVRACGLRRRPAASWETRTGTVLKPAAEDGCATLPKMPRLTRDPNAYEANSSDIIEILCISNLSTYKT